MNLSLSCLLMEFALSSYYLGFTLKLKVKLSSICKESTINSWQMAVSDGDGGNGGGGGE